MELPLYTRSVTSGLQTTAITSKGGGERKQGPTYRTPLEKGERKAVHAQMTLWAEKGNFSGMKQLNARSCSSRGKKVMKQPPHSASAIGLYPHSPHGGEDHHQKPLGTEWFISAGFEKILKCSKFNFSVTVSKDMQFLHHILNLLSQQAHYWVALLRMAPREGLSSPSKREALINSTEA